LQTKSEVYNILVLRTKYSRSTRNYTSLALMVMIQRGRTELFSPLKDYRLLYVSLTCKLNYCTGWSFPSKYRVQPLNDQAQKYEIPELVLNPEAPIVRKYIRSSSTEGCTDKIGKTQNRSTTYDYHTSSIDWYVYVSSLLSVAAGSNRVHTWFSIETKKSKCIDADALRNLPGTTSTN